jgi:hypothetical protein
LSIYINYKLFINFFTQTGADFYNKLTISQAQYIRRFCQIATSLQTAASASGGGKTMLSFYGQALINMFDNITN